ncbi:MAG TPA: ribosomal L7Ae/L30e/S12e/Gadd45 family protein [Candidatus Limosilactobacillus faecipullorum]|nr:ribosomal L7Ae/L30e/S12e/Gadd45 family protein [Candidatus Limosilactobacillus faecipullorum]
MNNQQRILNLLGLARRASQLTTGEGAVIKSLRAQQIKLIFLASDAGNATKKKVTDKATFYQVPVCQQFSQRELSIAIGQKRTVIGIKQVGFANQFQKLLKIE